MLSKLVARLVVRLNERTPEIETDDSAFFDQTCIKCGSSFDVPPDVVFDRRRAYYCDECL